MEINPIWFSLTVIGLIGMTVNAVKWFILDKDYSKSSFLVTGAWLLIAAIGFTLALIFK